MNKSIPMVLSLIYIFSFTALHADEGIPQAAPKEEVVKTESQPAVPVSGAVVKKEEANTASAETAATPAVSESKKTTATIAVKTHRQCCFSHSADKFGRGFSNIVFSVFEIPYGVVKEAERTNAVAAFATGTLKGVGRGVMRLVAGVYEVATFIIPQNPIIRPFEAGWLNS